MSAAKWKKHLDTKNRQTKPSISFFNLISLSIITSIITMYFTNITLLKAKDINNFNIIENKKSFIVSIKQFLCYNITT